MPTLTPLDSISHEPSQDLLDFKATLEKAIEKNASVIENTHFTLRGIAQLLDISKDLWEFYRYHAQGVKLTSEQLETLKREINTLSTHINQTLENLNDQKTKATELLQETTTKLTQAQQLAAQSQADMQAARQALETIKTLETKLPEIQTQLESINSAISNAIDKKQELEDRASELKIEISTALTQKKTELETQLTEKKTQLESELETQLTEKKTQLESELETSLTEKKTQLETQLESTLTQAARRSQEALETKRQEIETQLESIKADTQAIKTQTQELATQAQSKADELNTKASELATKQEQIEQAHTQAQAQLESITQAAQATTTELAEAKEQATRGIESYKAGFLSDISIEFAKMMEHFTPTSAIALSALSARVAMLEKGLFEYEMLSHITSHFYTIQDMVYADQSYEGLEIPQGCSRAYIVAYGGAEQVSARNWQGSMQGSMQVSIQVLPQVSVGGLQGEDIVAQAGEFKAQQCYFQGERMLEINVDAVGGFVLVLFFTNRVTSKSDDPFFSIHTDIFGLESSGLNAYLAHLESLVSLGGGDTLRSQALDQLTQAAELATQQSLSAFKNADFTSLKSFYTARLEYENTRKQIARQNGLQVPAPIDTQPYLDNAIDRGMLAYYIYLHNRRTDNELITRTFPLVLEQIAALAHTHQASTQIALSFSADDLQALSSYFDSLGPLYRGGFSTEQERRTNLGFYLTYMAHAQGQRAAQPADQMGWILGEIYRHLGRPNLANTLKYTQMTKILHQEIPSEKSVATLKAYIKATIDSDVESQAEQRASACVRGLQDTHAQGIFAVLAMIKGALS